MIFVVLMPIINDELKIIIIIFLVYLTTKQTNFGNTI